MYAQPPLAIEALSSPSARFPQEILNKIGEKLLTQWRKGKYIHITCDRDTDIRATIDPQYVHATTRPMIRGESFGGWHGGSEVIHLWPAWTTEGVIYFDSVTMFRGRLSVPCKMTVKKRRVVKVDGGGEQVAFYEEAFKKHRDANHLGEFGVGLNPKVQIVLDDLAHSMAERHAGAVHCGIGSSIESMFTGKPPIVSPGFHNDNFVLKPTVYIGEEICVENGRLRILEDPEITRLAEKFSVTL